MKIWSILAMGFAILLAMFYATGAISFSVMQLIPGIPFGILHIPWYIVLICGAFTTIFAVLLLFMLTIISILFYSMFYNVKVTTEVFPAAIDEEVSNGK